MLLVLLAAGRSQRFGEGDKLAAEWRDLPLALHAAETLASLPFMGRIAVVSGTTVDFAALGYRAIINPAPENGLSGSVALGVAAALDLGAAAVLIALADMPCVTAAHVMRLMDAANGPAAVVASCEGNRLSPPALFGAGRFAELLAGGGDAGGRSLLQAGVHVQAAPGELIDIDTPADLERLRTLA